MVLDFLYILTKFMQYKLENCEFMPLMFIGRRLHGRGEASCEAMIHRGAREGLTFVVAHLVCRE